MPVHPLAPFRAFPVPSIAAGMRLDRFLATWFKDHSRSSLVRGIRNGEVTLDDGRALRASAILRGGELLRLYLDGIAPREAAPPFPPIVYEDDRFVIIDKPAGLLTHPAGNDFTWAVISLAKLRWPDDEVDLAHRIDRDTSGLLVLTRDLDANRWVKRVFHDGEANKEYDAICRGVPPWTHATFDGPIGPADGPIRIQMAVRPDGLDAFTEATVVATQPEAACGPISRVRCAIRTGRTHQIRVHLAHAGYSLLGDRMYGVPPEVFLHAWENGADDSTIAAAGAPRHALHAARLRLPHPDGGEIEAEAPFPGDLTRWWADPSVLPFDRDQASESSDSGTSSG
jgi:RluA family pseudouridine synthase